MSDAKRTRALRAALVAGSIAALAATPAHAEQPGIEGSMGPSTHTPPYVLPVAAGVRTASLLTVGDSVEGYRMAGIPDGMGAYRNDGNGLTLLMNHEINELSGNRAPARTARRVRVGVVDRSQVVRGHVRARSHRSGRPVLGLPRRRVLAVPADGFDAPFDAFNAPFDRFCSNTLTTPGQLFNEETGNGYEGQLFFPSEENGNIGRSFGLTTDGAMAQLPRLGLFSYENVAPAYNSTDTTLAFGSEDEADGQLWIYAGTKQAGGSPFDRAGLNNGVPSVASVAGATTDAGFRATYGKDTPARFALNEVNWNQDGNALNAEAKAKGLSLDRIEDSHWDPASPNDLYFLTTESGKGADTPTGRYGRDGGGLWRMRFDDIERPGLGGTLTLLLDGSEEPFLNKPDNMTIDGEGNLLIQEDPGNNVSLARIVAYRIADGARGVLARFDPALFGWRGAQAGERQPRARRRSADVRRGVLGDHRRTRCRRPALVPLRRAGAPAQPRPRARPGRAAAGPARRQVEGRLRHRALMRHARRVD